MPPRPARDARLDLLRGWLQLTIFMSHATGSWIGAWLIHAHWGLSDSSEQFVFLSGMTLGSVFARNAAKGGWRAAAWDLLGRTSRLYRTNLIVCAGLCAGAVAIGATVLPGEAVRAGWGDVLAQPALHVPLVALTVEQPNFTGILPLFVWCMLLLPGFAAAEARWGDRALLLPVGLYALSWVALRLLPVQPYLEGIAFNPFAWQVLFLGGAWFGRRALLRGRALAFPPVVALAVTVAAAGVLLAALAVRLGWHGFVPEFAVPRSEWLTDKRDLAPPRLLHALALAWLIARVVPRERGWMDAAAVRWLGAIGRHSLHVFCVGVFLSWLATVAFRLAGYSPWLDVTLIGAGCCLLALFAAWRERVRIGLQGRALAGVQGQRP